MNERLFSLRMPCPDGFTFSGEFRAREFRKAPFALLASSPEEALEFLGEQLPRLAGVIMVPGDHYNFHYEAPLVSRIAFPPAMIPCLADFAAHQLAQLDRVIASEERNSFLTLENRRFEVNNQRAAEEFSRFRESLLREIEDRRATEASLRESERKFHAIFNQTFQFIGLLSLDGTLLEANMASMEFAGAAGGAIGKPFWETPWWSHSPEQQERLRVAIKRCAEGEFVRFEAVHPAADGNLHYVDFSLKPVFDETGNVVLLIPEGRDITERKLAEEQTRRDKALLRCLIDSVGDLIFIKDRNGVYQACNRAAEEFIGMPESEQIGKTDFDFFSPEVAEAVRVYDRQILASGREGRIEEMITRRNGSMVLLDTVKAPYYGPEGKQLGLVGIARDITERKRAEEALRQSEELFHTLCDCAPIGISRIDSEGNYIYCNPHFEKITGTSAPELMGMGWMKIIHPDDLEKLIKNRHEAISAGGIFCSEHRLLTPQGKTVWVRALANPLKSPDGRILSYVGTMEDITELLNARQDLMKSQKIESLGILAGGIAHDFNNILTIILGNVSLARLQLNDPEKVTMRLEEAEKATARAKDLAQQLLTFARGGEPVKKIIDVRRLLKEAAGFALHGSNVKGKFTLADNLWPVEADEGQLGQVIQNLVLNSVQAMPEGGTVIIGAENVQSPEGGDRYVNITVADSGAGISEDHLQRIFDPYFTTKQKGSGLGLATCYSIITKHGGKIEATSTLGKGSTFHISLPASQHTGICDPDYGNSVFLGSGCVLVMDDEEDIRNISKALLEGLGYTVESCENGSTAIDLYRKRKEEGKPFTAVILDLTIPGGVGGKVAMESLLRIDPDIKAIVSSGYSTDPIMANYREYGFSAVLAKPYRSQELSRALQELFI